MFDLKLSCNRGITQPNSYCVQYINDPCVCTSSFLCVHMHVHVYCIAGIFDCANFRGMALEPPEEIFAVVIFAFQCQETTLCM